MSGLKVAHGQLSTAYMKMPSLQSNGKDRFPRSSKSSRVSGKVEYSALTSTKSTITIYWID